MLAERHRGIRPAFGYPACPDHSEKFKLFDLLDAREVGIALTENAAMMPAASVSGLYFAHPQARYFTVGRLGEDQIASYARRKGQSIEQVERWLDPSLAYEPAGVDTPDTPNLSAPIRAGHSCRAPRTQPPARRLPTHVITRLRNTTFDKRLSESLI